MNDNHEEHEEGLTPEEELHAENQLELLRLDMKYGAQSFISDDAPPEVVKHFIQQVKTFEAKWNEAPVLTTVALLLEGTSYPNSDSVADHELEEAIDLFIDLLFEKGIAIDRPDHLTAREYYEFLTGDLLDQAVLEDRPEGFINGLLYNDIRKDDPEEIPEIALEEIHDVIYSVDYEGYHLGPEELFEDDMVSIMDKVYSWQEKYPGRTITRLELDTHVTMHGVHCLTFDIEIEYNVGRKRQAIQGICMVTIELMQGEYYVTSLCIPGLRL